MASRIFMCHPTVVQALEDIVAVPEAAVRIGASPLPQLADSGLLVGASLGPGAERTIVASGARSGAPWPWFSPRCASSPSYLTS
jgi:hypothetical protein